jgi:hypothetical protein
MTSDPERVAIHEAGHAIAAIAQHRRIKCASIEADEQSHGHVALRELHGLTIAMAGHDDAVVKRARDKLEREANIAVAGAVAEELRFGGVGAGSENDLEKAGRAIHGACASQDECNAYLGWLTERARALLSMHWGAVLAVAEALVQERKVQASRVAALFEEHAHEPLREFVKAEEASSPRSERALEFPGTDLNALLGNRLIAELGNEMSVEEALRAALIHAIILLQDAEEPAIKNYCTFVLMRFEPLAEAFRAHKHPYFGNIEVMRGQRSDGSATLFLPLERLRRELSEG